MWATGTQVTSGLARKAPKTGNRATWSARRQRRRSVFGGKDVNCADKLNGAPKCGPGSVARDYYFWRPPDYQPTNPIRWRCKLKGDHENRVYPGSATGTHLPPADGGDVGLYGCVDCAYEGARAALTLEIWIRLQLSNHVVAKAAKTSSATRGHDLFKSFAASGHT
jgi:hypothetical protein